MNTIVLILFIIGPIVFFGILYFVIRIGVRDGIQDSNWKKSNEDELNSLQLSLKKKYENGEISFETYQSEWNK